MNLSLSRINTARVIGQLVTAVLLLTLPAMPAIAQSMEQLFDRINASANTTSYKGTLTYSHGAHTEAMQVFRAVNDQGFRERIYALTGTPSEIIRTNKAVWCYFPDRKEGFYKATNKNLYRISDLQSVQVSELRKYYSMQIRGQDRIANRLTKRVLLVPKDAFRYGHEMWIDEETGLLLRSDLLETDAGIIDSYMFVDITLDAEISDSDLQPSLSSTNANFAWGFSLPDDSPMTADELRWAVKSVPDGFKKVKHVRSTSDNSMTEQIIFSDNLATVSLFIQKQDENENGFVGFSRLGSVNAYGRIINDYHVIVMGDVPARTVSVIGNSVIFKH